MSQTKIKIKRHIAKAISYRFIGTLQTMIIGYIFTGNFVIASSMGLVEILIKPLIYFFHERVWYKWIKFGVTEEPEKKKKVTGITEGKVKSQIKVYDDELPKTQAPPPPKPTGRKVLNYSSNR